jgi:pimeloyl-ACP methyl ester carboxylesterase
MVPRAAATPEDNRGGQMNGYAPVNGMNLYYEIHGEGEPLVLLHPGLGSIEMFGDMLPALARTRRVVGVDLQAHGHTADIDRPLRFETMGDDVAALIRYLGVEKTAIAGYSLGANVALRTAIQHPNAVSRLALISIPCRRNGWYPEVLAGMAQVADMAEATKQSAIYKVYARLAPRPEDWPVLLRKTGELLGRDYDWSGEVAAMRTPTMLVYADADAIRPSHAIEFFELLGGGKRDGGLDGSGMSAARLAFLPGMTHYNLVSSPLLPEILAGFLAEKG